MRSSQANFCQSSHVTISNFAPKMTLCGRVKACKIIGCHSEYFWGYSHSNFLLYILCFCPFKALSIFIAKLLDFKVWKNYTLRDFCSQTGPTKCHENYFNSKTIWSRNLKFWICSYPWIIGQHIKKNEQDPRTKCVGHHLIWRGMTHMADEARYFRRGFNSIHVCTRRIGAMMLIVNVLRWKHWWPNIMNMLVATTWQLITPHLNVESGPTQFYDFRNSFLGDNHLKNISKLCVKGECDSSTGS